MRKFAEYLAQRDLEVQIEETAWMMASNGIDPIRYIYNYANHQAWLEADTTGDVTGSQTPGQQPNPMAMVQAKQTMGDMMGNDDQGDDDDQGGKMPQSQAEKLYAQALHALKLLDDKLPDGAKGLITGLHAQLKAQEMQIKSALQGANEPDAQPQATDKPIDQGDNKGTEGSPTNVPMSAPMNAGTAVPQAAG